LPSPHNLYSKKLNLANIIKETFNMDNKEISKIKSKEIKTKIQALIEKYAPIYEKKGYSITFSFKTENDAKKFFKKYVKKLFCFIKIVNSNGETLENLQIPIMKDTIKNGKHNIKEYDSQLIVDVLQQYLDNGKISIVKRIKATNQKHNFSMLLLILAIILIIIFSIITSISISKLKRAYYHEYYDELCIFNLILQQFLH
jgi:hypothetical protein